MASELRKVPLQIFFNPTILSGDNNFRSSPTLLHLLNVTQKSFHQVNPLSGGWSPVVGAFTLPIWDGRGHPDLVTEELIHPVTQADITGFHALQEKRRPHPC
jgi:hypothetical protein